MADIIGLLLSINAATPETLRDHEPGWAPRRAGGEPSAWPACLAAGRPVN
jgi:hypothetical protein